MAISNDSVFVAAGSIYDFDSGDQGEVALFRLEDGSELRLPSSPACFGARLEAVTVCFNEESTALLASVHKVGEAAGKLHVWKHLDRAGDIQHLVLPFDRISPWATPMAQTVLTATNDYIAIRRAGSRKVCVYDVNNDQYSLVTSEEEDDSGLLQVSNLEYRAFEKKGSLFMTPFERVIRYCHGSGSEVLGALEEKHSFQPDQWTFCEDTGLFVVGRPGGKLVGAVLMNEDRTPQGGSSEAPALPLLWKKETPRSHNSIGAGDTDEREFKVFISHAGPDKKDIAIPLHERLEKRRIRAFVDDEELRVGEDAIEEMQQAMDGASVGVFILSPEFAGRRWTLKELICFLERRRAAGRGPKTPALIPVFYRLGVRDCQSRDLYGPGSEIGKIIFQEGFYAPQRQAETSTEKAEQAMREVTKFTGIEYKDGGCGNGDPDAQIRRDDLLDKIAEEVEKVVQRLDVGRGEEG